MLKRDIIQGEEADNAQTQIKKFYRKASKKKAKTIDKKTEEEVHPTETENSTENTE